ncbi:hypothetical protein MTO96_042988, partial [Rhipicephalus appendiculatus]
IEAPSPLRSDAVCRTLALDCLQALADERSPVGGDEKESVKESICSRELPNGGCQHEMFFMGRRSVRQLQSLSPQGDVSDIDLDDSDDDEENVAKLTTSKKLGCHEGSLTEIGLDVEIDGDEEDGSTDNAALKEKGLLSVGTARVNRLPGCSVKTDAALKKSGRGSFDVCTEVCNNIAAVKWLDNKPVHLVSSYIGSEPVDQVQRWSATTRSHVTVQQPAIVKEYNRFMGGVDLCNMLVELYRCDIRGRRYYLRIVFHIIDICVVNAWLLYRRHCSQAGTQYQPLLDFRMTIAHALLKAGKIDGDAHGRFLGAYAAPATAVAYLTSGCLARSRPAETKTDKMAATDSSTMVAAANEVRANFRVALISSLAKWPRANP